MKIEKTLEKTAAEIESQVPDIDALKEKLNDLNDKVVTFIKTYPAQTLLGAVALGFLVAKVARLGGSHGK